VKEKKFALFHISPLPILHNLPSFLLLLCMHALWEINFHNMDTFIQTFSNSIYRNMCFRTTSSFCISKFVSLKVLSSF